MIIVLKPQATRDDADALMRQIESSGLKPLYMPGSERVVLGALGDERVLAEQHFDSLQMVESVTAVLAPYKAVSREMQPQDTVVRLSPTVEIGGDAVAVVAGPCSVESYEQMKATAEAVKSAGAVAIRGGAYKPRTSPYAFQGLGMEGLEILQRITAETGLPAVTEVVEVADVHAVEEHAAAFQIGARNMQNFRLLQAVGKSHLPVILKRGMAAKVDDLLMAAEYILAEGNGNVILCERGIRTFETATRNTLDLNAVPYLKAKTHLPVVVDPSHGTGVRDFVTPMALAAVACGADGLLVEVHNDPAVAKSDGPQSLFPEQFAKLMDRLRPVAEAVGRSVATVETAGA